MSPAVAEQPVANIRQPVPGVFVTGTDTGAGKTFVACALLHALARHGVRAVGMKPVAAGGLVVESGNHNDDALALNRASAVESPMELVNPYCLADPIAPHIAARDAGVTIDPAHIGDRYRQLSRGADLVVVEGAGGLLVPLGPGLVYADLAQALGLPTLLVVGMRLGCINHALLTAEAMMHRGLRFAGWVANRIDPAMLRWEDNLEALRERLPGPFLGTVPFAADDPAEAGRTLDIRAFLSNLGGDFARR
jgi:dethiobiotin synthetase